MELGEQSPDEMDGRLNVHVHISPSDIVEPGPTESCESSLQLFRDRDFKLADTVLAIVVVAVRAIFSEEYRGSGSTTIAARTFGMDWTLESPRTRVLARLLFFSFLVTCSTHSFRLFNTGSGKQSNLV